jgi:hypothetical protein
VKQQVLTRDPSNDVARFREADGRGTSSLVCVATRLSYASPLRVTRWACGCGAHPSRVEHVRRVWSTSVACGAHPSRVGLAKRRQKSTVERSKKTISSRGPTKDGGTVTKRPSRHREGRYPVISDIESLQRVQLPERHGQLARQTPLRAYQSSTASLAVPGHQQLPDGVTRSHAQLTHASMDANRDRVAVRVSVSCRVPRNRNQGLGLRA